MTNNKYILVGIKAEGGVVKQYGGVLTLSNGLTDYAHRAGFDIDVINTMRSGFEHLSLSKRLKAGVGRVFELIGLIRDVRPAGVIVFGGAGWSFYERVLLSLVCRIYNLPCVLFIVDGWFMDAAKKSALRRFFYGFLLKIPHVLAASGTNWVDLFRRLGVGEDRIVTIHYWLEKKFGLVDRPKALTDGETIRFVFVGWMIREKGINELLAALRELFKEHRFHFTFIGGGTLLESVRETIAASGWKSSVSVLGWQSPEQIDNAMSEAHVFVLPSYAEGFPMSLIEAMTKGMPAICTDVGGISDSLHDGVNGFLIPVGDAGALKRAMEFYIRNPAAVSAHSSATLEIVRANHDADVNCRLLFNSLGAAG